MNSRERKQASTLKRTRPEIKMEEDPDKYRTDPVKCPICSATLKCPRTVDYDVYMENKNLKCLSSSNPICLKAAKSPSNQPYITRLLQKVALK